MDSHISLYASDLSDGEWALLRPLLPAEASTGRPRTHAHKYYWVPNDIPPEEIDWSKYLPSPGFHVIPRRWVVERTFAWFSHNRRLSKDYERLCATSEAWIYLTMIHLMLRRIARF